MEDIREEFEDENIDGYRFRIADDQTAEWAMSQIRMANEEKEKWKAFYDDRYAKVCATCDLTIANMEAMLQTYFESVPHKVTKTQENYTLPSGKLVVKRQEPEYQRTDAEVIEWLYKNTDNPSRFIKTKESLDWSELKRHISVVGDTVADENGQVIPCITVVERPDVFKVELKKGDKQDE